MQDPGQCLSAWTNYWRYLSLSRPTLQWPGLPNQEAAMKGMNFLMCSSWSYYPENDIEAKDDIFEAAGDLACVSDPPPPLVSMTRGLGGGRMMASWRHLPPLKVLIFSCHLFNHCQYLKSQLENHNRQRLLIIYIVINIWNKVTVCAVLHCPPLCRRTAFKPKSIQLMSACSALCCD